MGAGLGAIALAVVGFNWGGWMTARAAEELSYKQSTAAAALALTPYCVSKSKDDPKAIDILADIERNTSTYKKREFIENAGWATPLGAEKPNRFLADACLVALSKTD